MHKPLTDTFGSPHDAVAAAQALDIPATPDLLAHVHELRRAHRFLARQDAAAFASYVVRNEEDGKPLLLSDVHREWHQLADAHNRLIIWSNVESGKSVQMSIARPLYELGRNPNLRIAVLSNTHKQAEKIVRVIGKYIEDSAELREVFPGLEPSPKHPWTQDRLTVKRQTHAKDASVTAFGVHGNVLGSRFDLLIVDDILDFENTRTQHQRDALEEWLNSTVLTRLTSQARVIVIGTAWHRDDIMHRWAKSRRWHAMRYGVYTPDGEPAWPARWPVHRIEEKRIELGPTEFARSLLCEARTDDESWVQTEWIKRALRQGAGMPLGPASPPLGSAPTFTGVDLSVGSKPGRGDLTCLFTIQVDPRTEQRHVVDIQSGRWQGPEILDRIIRTHRRYGSLVIVENNAAQEYLAQFLRASTAIPVISFTTTSKSLRHQEYGLHTLAVEFANGKWTIPCDSETDMAPEVREWIDEVLYYSPSAHAGDRLMASWFARQGTLHTKPEAGFLQLHTTRR